MKRIIALFISLFMVACLFSACEENKPTEEKETEKYGKIIYVSVDGNDSNDGAESSPLATFGGAVAKVREYKTANGLPDGGIKVEFESGIYKVTEGVVFTDEDSGEEGKPIVYAAADGSEVIFDGGITLSSADFKPVNDDFKAILQTEEAKNSVLEIDLIAAGFGDYEEFAVPSLDKDDPGFASSDWTNILYVNNETQTVARWPNGEYEAGELFKPWDKSYTWFRIPSEKAGLWSSVDNMHAFGYARNAWSPAYTDSVCVDTENSAVGIALKHYSSENNRFYLFNIPCELDEPGEYYIDAAADKLYYWPVEGFENAKISLSNLRGWFIDIDSCDYISFDGLTIENLRFGAIHGTGSDITINGCILRCMSNNAIELVGNRHTISNNELAHLGFYGMLIDGGDTNTYGSACSVIVNNKVHDIAEVYRSSTRCIAVNGSGFYIAHNELYNSPHEAIKVIASNSMVEYNEIYNVCSEVSDSGAIYSNGSYSIGATVYRYNYIHDITGRAGMTAGNAIYIDDTCAFRTVYSNIIVNVDGRGLALSGGRNLTAYNNVMVNTGRISLDCRGFTWYPTKTSYSEGALWQSISEVDLFNSVWKYAQPELLSILEMRTTEELKPLRGIDPELLDSPAPPAYADIYSNIAYNTIPADSIIRSDNIINGGSYIIKNFVDGHATPLETEGNGDVVGSAYLFGSIHDNLMYLDEASDIFVDPVNGNFFLKDDSRVYRDIVGFEKWDYSLIGIQK